MDHPNCPHCGAPLSPFTLPEAAGWGELQLACFADDCPYYRRGWTWMEERFGVRSSYRYRVDPESGVATPLPVWSPTALKDRVVDAHVEASAGPCSCCEGGAS